MVTHIEYPEGFRYRALRHQEDPRERLYRRLKLVVVVLIAATVLAGLVLFSVRFFEEKNRELEELALRPVDDSPLGEFIAVRRQCLCEMLPLLYGLVFAVIILFVLLIAALSVMTFHSGRERPVEREFPFDEFRERIQRNRDR